MNLTEEDIKAIKEDIQKGLKYRKIVSKYHITIFQYKEIKDSMQSHEPQDHISESRPTITKRRRRKGNVSFLGLIFLVLFVITLFHLIYKKSVRTGYVPRIFSFTDLRYWRHGNPI